LLEKWISQEMDWPNNWISQKNGLTRKYGFARKMDLPKNGLAKNGLARKRD
jgi:hypothetical protein